jgi:branched-chain amino acid transport system substrate-binding protein
MVNQKIFKYLVGFFLLLILNSTIDAKTQTATKVRKIPAIEEKFQSALKDYRTQKYQSALVKFDALSKSPLLHQRMTISLLMTGKSLYQLGRYTEAKTYFKKLINLFPASKYVDDAYYAKAIANYRQNQFFKSLKDLFWVVDNSPSRRLVNKGSKIASFILSSEMRLSELRKLLKFARGEKSRALLTLQLSKKELTYGSPDKAVSLLTEFKKKYSSSSYLPRIDKLLREAKNYGNRPIRIGVILPLTGYYAEEGLGILRGIKYAQMQNQNPSGLSIQLVVRDSKSNMIQAINEVKNMAKDEDLRVIIGELESSITAGVGALASIEHLPVIAPAATENELASVGESVFQLNSDLERKGQALAEYAIETLGLRTFATLAPADDYGQQMTSSFTAKIDELGGRIIAQSWYYGNPQDLSRQFKSIRETAFHFDSTDVEEMIKTAELKGEELEERDIPVQSIDAIFLPVYTDDIKYVAPQFALHNILAQILGGEYWDNLEVLQKVQIQRYINGAIFISDYFSDEDSRVFRNFRTDFRLKMKKTPERWEAFGYDAFNIIRSVINNGAKTRQEIAEKLTSLSNYEGVKGKISFDRNKRVNKEVNILQFINGRIVKLK